jgi:hypothetical protein
MQPTHPTPRVDLSAISPLDEIVIRAGDLSQPIAAQFLIAGYTQFGTLPGVYGISVVFHQGYGVDQLAKAACFPNGKIAYSVIANIQDELTALNGGYALVLFVTPTPRFADHHTLGITRNGQIETTLDPAVANALLRAFKVVSNPYKKP